jgi:hypothetical protein
MEPETNLDGDSWHSVGRQGGGQWECGVGDTVVRNPMDWGPAKHIRELDSD